MEFTMGDFNQSKYIQDYKKEKYSRAVIDFKKEEKDIITEHWKKKGFKTFSDYIRHLIEQDMNGGKGVTVRDIHQKGDNNTINIG